jgi:C4-dicarboxylate transporter DctM subunit
VSGLAVGGLGVLGLAVLILFQVPIGIAMIVVGTLGYALQTNWSAALTMLASEPSGILSSVDLATVPLFLLMGTFVTAAGFSKDIYDAAGAMLGHRRGGLGYATILGCAAFGSVCGSSTATAATFAKAALPEMLSRGYAPSFATATIAAGGALKALIPPSIVMILYCIVAKTFITDIFYAAIVPAFLVIALNLLTIWIIVRVYPELAPVEERVALADRLRAVKKAIPVGFLLLVVFTGLYSGVFTVNEAASVAAVAALLFALLRGSLTWGQLVDGFRQTASVTAMIYVVIIGASIFGYFITLGRVPEALINVIQKSGLTPSAIIFALLVTYLLLGCVFDEIAAVLITLPLVLPIIASLHYDPLWWGIMNVVFVELGMIHPPMGIIVFILHGMAPQISLGTIYRGVAPFVVADLVLLLILTIFPSLTTWLPKLLAG